MVMLVWLVLSLCGVCEFTWLPVFIDAVIVGSILGVKEKSSHSRLILANVSLGVALFAFYKFFFGLNVSIWWILISPIAMLIMLLFPGGITITNFILKSYGLMTLPAWGMIVGIILDILTLILLIYIIADSIKNKKEKRYVRY